MKHSPRSGQMMLLTTLALGSMMLGVTTIAGLLMIFQLRQTTNFADSAKAIFAADAGIEWSLYNFSCQGDPDAKPCIPSSTLSFSNGAKVSVSNDGLTMKSIGSAGSASRAFLLSLQ